MGKSHYILRFSILIISIYLFVAQDCSATTTARLIITKEKGKDYTIKVQSGSTAGLFKANFTEINPIADITSLFIDIDGNFSFDSKLWQHYTDTIANNNRDDANTFISSKQSLLKKATQGFNNPLDGLTVIQRALEKFDNDVIASLISHIISTSNKNDLKRQKLITTIKQALRGLNLTPENLQKFNDAIDLYTNLFSDGDINISVDLSKNSLIEKPFRELYFHIMKLGESVNFTAEHPDSFLWRHKKKILTSVIATGLAMGAIAKYTDWFGKLSMPSFGKTNNETLNVPAPEAPKIKLPPTSTPPVSPPAATPGTPSPTIEIQQPTPAGPPVPNSMTPPQESTGWFGGLFSNTSQGLAKTGGTIPLHK
jgi:hypothetical protein